MFEFTEEYKKLNLEETSAPIEQLKNFMDGVKKRLPGDFVDSVVKNKKPFSKQMKHAYEHKLNEAGDCVQLGKDLEEEMEKEA